MSIVSVVPFSGDERDLNSTVELASPSSAWAHPSQPLTQPPQSPSHVPRQMQSAALETKDECSHVSRASFKDGTPAVGFDVTVFSESIDAGPEVSVESDIPADLDNNSIIDPPDVVQIHKLVVSVVELFVFTGTAYASESFVRLGFPALKFCDQFDPMRASWLEFVQSVFDLLST
jgi:hypothetical protein